MKIACLTFERIGQGLFYTGRLNNGRNFNFVYDCGSVSRRQYLSAAIDHTRDKMDIFDMVVISHFDEDHVNGIADLIRNKRVKLLVLPYVTWVERMMLYAHSTSEDREYIQLLSDPIAFFSNNDRFNIDSIVIVSGPDTPPSDNPDMLPPSPEKTTEERNNNDLNQMEMQFLVKSSNDKKLLDEISSTFSTNRDNIFTSNRRLSFYKTPFSLIAGNIWEFHFYNQQSTDTKLQARFHKAILLWIKKEGIEIEHIFDDRYRNDVRLIYKKFYKNLNQTSLILYHGPTDWQQSLGNSLRYVYSNEKNGTLLTGDLNISKVKVLADIMAYYKDRIPKTGVFSIPHHAAFGYWHFSHPSGLENFEAYVVSAGINRKHHPSPYVIADIREYCTGEIIFSDEARSYTYIVLLD